MVSGNDVYAAGYERIGHNDVAKYWKNGNAVNLTDGLRDAQATSIAVADGIVYVCGKEFDGEKMVAKYWKNKTPVLLGDGSTESNATAILVVPK